MPGSFLLTLKEGDGSVKERRLALGSYVIGRELDFGIVVSSSDVSQHHARLTLNQVELVIEDLGSSTGTRVQDLPVTTPQRWPYPQSLSVGSVSLDVRPFDGAQEVPITALGADPRASVPFVFGNEIARGGMGSIIEANDQKLGRKIAVKVMLLESDDTDGHDALSPRSQPMNAGLEYPLALCERCFGLRWLGKAGCKRRRIARCQRSEHPGRRRLCVHVLSKENPDVMRRATSLGVVVRMVNV